jgi:hypothetical protein
MEIQETEIKYCKRCQRKLKGARSLERGIGPDCYDKWVKEGIIKPEFTRRRRGRPRVRDNQQMRIF